MFQAVERGADRITQAPFLTNLREQPRAHAAAEHSDGSPGPVIVGMSVLNGIVGDSDVRLRRVVINVINLSSARTSNDLRRRLGFPVAKRLRDEVQHLADIDAPRNSQD